MKSLSIIIIALAVLVTGLLAGCNSLALSGGKKYSVDMNGAYVNIRNDVENDGMASDKNIAKLEALLDKYRDEYGSKGSFLQGEEALKELKQAAAEPDSAYKHNQRAITYIMTSQDYLRTEIGD